MGKAVVTGEVTWLVSQTVGGDTGTGALVRVTVGVVVGAITYVVLLAFLRVPEVGELQRRVRARRASS